MALFHSDNPKEKQHKGISGAFAVDVIKWEPASSQEAAVISHKFEYEDFPNGSYLIVAASQTAVFINNLSAGNSLEQNTSGATQVSVFVGPCKIKLETGDSRFAPFRNMAHALTGGESAFHSTVYFLNTTYMNELSWGTRAPILVQDPDEEVNVHVRAFGFYGVHLDQLDPATAASNARKFLQRVVGTQSDYTRTELEEYMRAKILEYVPDLLANNMIEQNVGVLKISAKLSMFSEIIHRKLIPYFSEIGLSLDNFSFHNINVPDEDLRAINEMKIQRKSAQLEAEGAAARMDIESAARARMREREGYTYQQEKSYEVMQSAAQNEGTASSFVGAGMGLGMGVGLGGAVGSGFNALARETMQNINAPAAPAQPESEAAVCQACGNKNPAGAKFCLSCGEKLAQGSKCPNCGAALPTGAKFCLECGTRLAVVCPNCGTPLAPGAKFCLECGTKL